ncbi:hypothetical protein ACRBU7_11010 [Priestia aryabhattai]|uniref:hypothetical protein n=1 Tax=Priestia aryabhattai TaxID=412384 RepID=UPI003D7F8C94
MERNTDVHGSIAGYHKQIYVATELLTSLKTDDDAVGIECGADVVCFFKDGKKASREVKFYKNNFSQFHSEIVKTIFNFYVNSSDNINLLFTTNVSMTKMEQFYNDWDSDTKINYLKQCLIRYSIKNVQEYKQNFEEYKDKKGILDDSKAVESLVKDILELKEEEYQHYANENKKVDFLKFSELIEFEFENLGKEESINRIKGEVRKNLSTLINELQIEIELDDKVIDAIMFKINDEFFESCVKNSLTKKEINYTNYQKIKVSDMKCIIQDYSNYVNKYSKDVVLKKIMSVFKTDFLIDEMLVSYIEENEDYKLYLEKYPGDFNEFDCKEWLQLNDRKFINDETRDNLVERFKNYKKGLGFISFLIQQNIKLINVYTDKLFVETYYGEKKTLDNNEYYHIDNIIQFINYNVSSSDSAYQQSTIGDISLLNNVISKEKTVQVTKPQKAISLSEYIKYNNMPEELNEILKRIITKQNNCMVIGNNLVDKVKLFNALSGEISHTKTVISISEDNSFKLLEKKIVANLTLNDLDQNIIRTKLINYKDCLIKDYDYKLFLLDNYYHIENTVLSEILDIFASNKGCLSSYRYAVKLDFQATIDRIIENHLNCTGKEISFDNVDNVIFLEKIGQVDCIRCILENKSQHWEEIYKSSNGKLNNSEI